MGNSAGTALPFEIVGNPIDYERKEWAFHAGLRKEDKEKREEVSILKFAKNAQDNKELWVPAQRSIQKLRTMKHPFIVSFVDSLEMDDAILLVTESCVPLSVWIKKQLKHESSIPQDEYNSQLLSEVVWGFRCLLEALLFLNTTCNMTHGFIGPHAIFVCKTGDWKLGALELSCNLGNVTERVYYVSKMNSLGDKYMASERRELSKLNAGGSIDEGWISKQGAADIYSVGVIVQDVLDQMNLEPSTTISKCLKKMISQEYKKRPSAKQALSFITDQMDLLSQLNELAIKPPNESLEILSKLSEHLKDIPVSACHHKVLPNVTKVLQMACNDFRNRDSRESCRQAVQLSLALLSSLSQANKLDKDIFSDTCLPVVLVLWTMSDRAIRTSLLRSLPLLIKHIPDSYVNKSLFDPMLNGFADTNAKMREETLKNLACIVDKLDERNLQDKLVRCITGLQADSEASIRTNAVIFVGRIASKLKEGVRTRVLCNALLKALSDGFVHCRIAGLRATIACLQYIDHPQLAGKMMPMCCKLTLDRSADVRELSLSFIEESTVILKQNHVVMKQQMEKEKAVNAQNSAAGDDQTQHSKLGGGDLSGYGLGNWSSFSWSAVDGIAKTLEKTIISSNSLNEKGSDPVVTTAEHTKQDVNQQLSFGSKLSTGASEKEGVALSNSSHHTTIPTGRTAAAGWSDDIEIDDEEDDDDVAYKSPVKAMSLSSSMGKCVNSWDDDPFDDAENDAFASKAVKVIEKKATVKADSSHTVDSPVSTTSLKPAATKLAATKPVSSSKKTTSSATKLAVTQNESWDDF